MQQKGLGQWLVKKDKVDGYSTPIKAPTEVKQTPVKNEPTPPPKRRSTPKKSASPTKKAIPKSRPVRPVKKSPSPGKKDKQANSRPNSDSEESDFEPENDVESESANVELDESSSVRREPSPSVSASMGSEQSPQPTKKRARGYPSGVTGNGSPPKKKIMMKTPTSLKSGTATYAKASSLDGVAVVFTGEFDSVTRQEVEGTAKSLGVLVRSAVSGKTDYLVHGSRLEDGRNFDEGSKYKSAMMIVNGQKKGHIKILNEAEWNSMVAEATSQAVEDGDTEMKDEFVETKTLPSPKRSTPARTADGASSLDKPELWVDRYRPMNPEDILGNRPSVNKLKEWLQDWHDVCILGHKKVPQGKPKWGSGYAEAERINARACMLSGPPGIGKTSTAIAVAKCLGFSINEFNASDNRSSADITKLEFLTQAGRTLFDMNYFTTKSNAPKTDKTVIIFDEMDGLSAGDRGGAQMLAKLIETTRVPIICICNDRYSPKVKTILSKCLDLRFSRPSITEIQKRLSIILSREGHIIEANALSALIEGSSNDIRSCINELQSMIGARAAREKSVTLRYNDVSGKTNKKDDGSMSKSPFDICRDLLTASSVNRMTYKDREELFFIDHDLVPKLIAQNYIAAASGLGGWGAPKMAASPQDELATLKNIASAATMIAKGDEVSAKIWTNQAWYLLPDVAFFTAIGPTYCAAKVATRVDFPSFMGKLSSRNKSKRLLKEISLSMNSAKVNATSRQLRCTGFLDLLYAKAMAPLVKNESPENVLASYKSMGISRSLLVDNIIPLRLKQQDQLYEKIDSKTKAALTRLENASNKGVIGVPRLVKSDHDGDDDDEDLDAMIKMKTAEAKAKDKSKPKGKGKSKAKSRAKAKSR